MGQSNVISVISNLYCVASFSLPIRLMSTPSHGLHWEMIPHKICTCLAEWVLSKGPVWPVFLAETIEHEAELRHRNEMLRAEAKIMGR